MSKAGQFAIQWADLQAGVQAAEDAAIDGRPPDVTARLNAAAAVQAEQHKNASLIGDDAAVVTGLVDGQLAGATKAKLIEDLDGLEKKKELHKRELLPTLHRLDGELKLVQGLAASAKHESSLRLYHRLRSISMLQSQISELRNKLHLYASLLNRVQAYCAQLHLMRRLPATYAACRSEILRRCAAAETSAVQIREAAEALAAAREREAGLRDEFMRSHGTLLPRGLPALSQLLQERPQFVEISSSTSDVRLMGLSTALLRQQQPPQHGQPEQAAAEEISAGGTEETAVGSDASGLQDGADMATEAPATAEEEKKEEEKEEEEEEVGVGAGGGANKDQSAAPSEAEMRQEPPEAVAAGAAASARVALTITATALAAADQPLSRRLRRSYRSNRPRPQRHHLPRPRRLSAHRRHRRGP